ncbi:hypothetical protein H4582DRAFT_1944174 [Lactarius indigo]|nr:hypothetical protein H4582DRAFT_1944174 [Lactarius indigo]
MGRTRTKNRKARPPIDDLAERQGEKVSEPTIEALLEKAQELIGDLLIAVLKRAPDNPDAKEMLGVVQLETGLLDAAKQTFLSLLPPNPGAPSPTPPSAHLYLAHTTSAAVDILMLQLKGKERAADIALANSDEEETKRTIVRALIGQVEIWMDPCITTLCFEPAAESNCEELLKACSVRMSQQRPEEAKGFLEKAWSTWQDLEADDPRLPPIASRLNLTKLFLELSLFTPALMVLQGIMASDDEEVEAWYLEGWPASKEAKSDELTWEELARDSRDCLETCKMLHINQGHPDLPIQGLGVKPSPEDEGWEDEEGDSSNSDVEMS